MPSLFGSLFNTATISTVLITGYIGFAAQKLYQSMNPLDGVEIKGPTIDPLWSANKEFKVLCFLGSNPRFKSVKLSELRENGQILFEKSDLRYNMTEASMKVDLFISNIPSLQSTAINNTCENDGSCVSDPPPLPQGDSEVLNKSVSNKIWKQVQTNKTEIYLHVLMVSSDSTKDHITHNMISNGTALYGNVKMIKYDKIPKAYRKRYLLSDFGWAELSELEQDRIALHPDSIISYWKPEVAVKIVTDFSRYPYEHVPMGIARNVVRKTDEAGRQKAYYKPSVFVDEIGLTSDKYIPLNSSVVDLPLSISFAPMSLQRWLLLDQMEQSFKEQEGLGFSEKDLDDVRRLISDTSVYLLAITFIASALHLLFEFLAFQSDISFWKNNKSLAGLSTRALVTDLFSQIVVFLFLLDSDSSLLITIPSFIAILIQMWKVQKATGLAAKYNSFGVPVGLEFRRWKARPSDEEDSSTTNSSADSKTDSKTDSSGESKKETLEGKGTDSSVSKADKEGEGAEIAEGSKSKDEILTDVTLEADQFATIYLCTLLLPLVVVFTLRSLLYETHLTWYSWGIGALTGSVYTFGFALMCPQLYINHKLKSVSHLPWKFLVFKFLNTFIDDLFAFIIKMPTMHRISCFRDDLVFLVYLYQRWIYRVDEDRPVEK